MKVTPKMKQNVFFQIIDDPIEAAICALKSKLIILVTAKLDEVKLTREQEADLTQIPASRLNDLKRGKMDKFKIDELLTIAMRVGFTMDSDMNLNTDNPLQLNITR